MGPCNQTNILSRMETLKNSNCRRLTSWLLYLQRLVEDLNRNKSKLVVREDLKPGSSRLQVCASNHSTTSTAYFIQSVTALICRKQANSPMQFFVWKGWVDLGHDKDSPN